MRMRRILLAVVMAVVLALTAMPKANASPLLTLNADEQQVPIIMYHKISKDSAQWDEYTISPQEFEEDLQYLTQEGYQPVFMADLIDYVNGDVILPNKPIVLTFDDGSFGVYEYALGMLERYDMKIVVPIIGKATDEMSEIQQQDNAPHILPHLTWTQISALINSGHVEIQNHTYDMHKSNGLQKKFGESEEEYKSRIGADLMKLQETALERTGIAMTTVAYPFGRRSGCSDKVLAELGFSASVTSNSGVSTITLGDKESLFGLKRIVRPHGVSSEKFFSKLSE